MNPDPTSPVSDSGSQPNVLRGTTLLEEAEVVPKRQLDMASSADRKSRKKRSRLSCIECRKKKMSCDRSLPCQRCRKSGSAEKCSFEDGAPTPTTVVTSRALHEQERRNTEHIRRLHGEIVALKSLLATSHPKKGVITGDTADKGLTQELEDDEKAAQRIQEAPQEEFCSVDLTLRVDSSRPSHPAIRSPRNYYTRHALFRFFCEIPDLFPFMSETGDEWLKPLGVYPERSRTATTGVHSKPQHGLATDPSLLLPPRGDVDVMVNFYLEHFEHVHRIVHIPCFRRDYLSFWAPNRQKHPAMLALILAMISLSAGYCSGSPKAVFVSSRYRDMSSQWISSCEVWIQEQSRKHRKLVHYQIMCLIYLARRVNNTRKKWFWKDTGSLVQDAVFGGLHDTSPDDSPYTKEMKRRMWATIRELDLQNAIEYGLPTLLYSIQPDAKAPQNLDDEEFNDRTHMTPTPEPATTYTVTSYQTESAKSWSLRLKISSTLCSTTEHGALSYDEVLRYTHEVTQAIGNLPVWAIRGEGEVTVAGVSRVAHAFLQSQLLGCVIALHRPYLQNSEGRFWLSRTICHQASRDILMMHKELAKSGLQSLTDLREDLFLASLTLTNITTLQFHDSTNKRASELYSTIDILKDCLVFVEERYLRCSKDEPCCFLTMCAAIKVIQTQYGLEDRTAAKSACAQQFLQLRGQRNRVQQRSSVQQPSPVANEAGGIFAGAGCLISPLQNLGSHNLGAGLQTKSGGEILQNSVDGNDGLFLDFDHGLTSLETEVDHAWDFLDTTWLCEMPLSGRNVHQDSV